MMYDLILTIKRGIHMTDFTDIKLKINEIIDKNKKIYFDSKTIADIEDIEEPKKYEKIISILLIPALITLGYSTDISLRVIRYLFSISPSDTFYTLVVVATIFSLLGIIGYSVVKLSGFIIKTLWHIKIKNIENGKLSKDKITEELFSDLFWKSKIDDETETVLKMILPYNLYLMLHSQRSSGLTYLDISKFLENIEKHEKEVKDIENKRISIGIDVIKASDIKDNVLVI